jgi:hypothetical protein
VKCNFYEHYGAQKENASNKKRALGEFLVGFLDMRLRLMQIAHFGREVWIFEGQKNLGRSSHWNASKLCKLHSLAYFLCSYSPEEEY